MMTEYFSESQYLQELERRGKLPAGFKAGGVPLTFVPRERPQGGPQKMNLSLIRLDEPSRVFAGVFTQNRFPGHPVVLGRRRLDADYIRGVLINNKIANVGSAGGLEAAEDLLSALDCSGGEGEEYFASSTGVIGWELPVKEMKNALPELCGSLSADSLLPLARGIMTTDAFPKLRSVEIGKGRIVAAAKGAGMIEPNMATMLCFVLTDLEISREELRRILPEVAEKTFNRITMDGDQSTSDMILAFSSCLAGPAAPEEFRRGLEEVCAGLAEDIVRNGEGCGHVMRIRLEGAPDENTAKKLAKAVGNSPLVKTAIAGNDPNVGRLLSALGDCAGNEGLDFFPEKLSLALGGEIVFQKGQFLLDADKEDRLVAYFRQAEMKPGHKAYPLHDRCVEIRIDLANGKAGAEVLAGDLTHEYVSENAEYRS